MLEENKFSYRALLHGKDAEWYFARGLDDITAAGSYEVRLFHNDMESLGITTADCDKEHYVVAHLFVSESAATGRQQALRVVGQTLLLTICATNAVKAFTRTCEVVPKGASWGSWVDLGAASTTDIQDGSITPQKLSSDIRTSIENPLRTLFIAAGAEYNAGVDKTRIAPWGESVTHKAGHYYLNGLGDITEEQMLAIYNSKDAVYRLNLPRAYEGLQFRTMIGVRNPDSVTSLPTLSYSSFSGNRILEVALWSIGFLYESTTSPQRLKPSSMFSHTFYNCIKLKCIHPIDVGSVTQFVNTFKSCQSLVELRLYGLKADVSLADSSKISKRSILNIIEESAPTSAITITLHPDAYARLADDVDVVAALEAQPLVSLVSA